MRVTYLEPALYCGRDNVGCREVKIGQNEYAINSLSPSLNLDQVRRAVHFVNMQ